MTKQAARLVTLTLALAALTGCTHAPTPALPPDFSAALAHHLSTIAQRDLAAFEDTLTRRDDLLVIFPAGQTLDSTAAVLDFHRQWFGDKKWVFTPEVIKTIEGSDMATALVRYAYRDSPTGEPRSSWLVLVFALEDNQWRLVHDQNTRIETAGT